MAETGNGAGPWQRRLVALEERIHLEAGLRSAQGAELAALGVVQRGLVGTVQSLRETQLEHGLTLADHGRRLEAIDVRLDTLEAKVDNVDLHVEDLDLKVDLLDEKVTDLDGKVDRILDLLTPGTP